MKILVGVVVLLAGAGAALWWWVTRPPADPREYVSQVWRDEHSRERRD